MKHMSTDERDPRVVNKDHTTNQNDVEKKLLSVFHWHLINISGGLLQTSSHYSTSVSAD